MVYGLEASSVSTVFENGDDQAITVDGVRYHEMKTKVLYGTLATQLTK